MDIPKPPNDKIVVYGTPTCPMVPPVRNMLNSAGVEYDYIDITFDASARAQVMEINGGNASVPTLIFLDGTTLTEPSGAQLRKKLTDLGFRPSFSALIFAYWNYILFAGAALLVLLSLLGVI